MEGERRRPEDYSLKELGQLLPMLQQIYCNKAGTKLEKNCPTSKTDPQGDAGKDCEVLKAEVKIIW